MGTAYPDIDLSQITIDNTVPPTPGGDDTVSEETSDSVHTIKQGAKDANTKTVVQLALDGSETPAAQSAVDPSIADGSSPVDPIASQGPPS